jgi:hypothetical protein
MNNGKIIRYGVIVQNCQGEIVANVQALIDKGEGWQPLGGIEITINGQFAQAVAQYATLETTIDPSEDDDNGVAETDEEHLAKAKAHSDYEQRGYMPPDPLDAT